MLENILDEILETVEAIVGGFVAGVILVSCFIAFIVILATVPIWILPFLIWKCCQDE